MKLLFSEENIPDAYCLEMMEKGAEHCLAALGLVGDAEISVSFVDEEEIRVLNGEYRNKDAVTDVLSFPMYEREELLNLMGDESADEWEYEPEEEGECEDMNHGDHGEDEGEWLWGPLMLGDVVICQERARLQAEEYGHSFERELIYLFVHSVFHLLGFDHMNERDKREMRKYEEDVMNLIGLPVRPQNVFETKDKGQVYEELISMGKEALKNSYAPFSKFRVGAALLTRQGRIYTGVNIENSSFGATICAERTAFVKAVSEGEREFSAIAVVSDAGSAWPCGICRQFMMEFCDEDFEIISLDEDGEIKAYTLAQMLPQGFRLEK